MFFTIRSDGDSACADCLPGCGHIAAELRDEFFNGEVVCSPKKAQIAIEQWRNYYNTIKPHPTLGYRPPLPQTFEPAVNHLDEIMPMQ